MRGLVPFLYRLLTVPVLLGSRSTTLAYPGGHSPMLSTCTAPSPKDTHCTQSQGHSFACAHCSTSRCPPSAASEHVYLSHGQPFARAHCSTSRCPPSAALAHVCSSHGQPFARNHFSTSSCPFAAASW